METIFTLNNTSLSDPNIERINNNSDVRNWLQTIARNKYKWSFDAKFSPSNIVPEDVSVISNNTTSTNQKIDYSHNGLIQYIFTAWAQELGVVLRPDMFLFTIVSEIKNVVYEQPDAFRSLFSTSNEKVDLTIVDLTIDRLVDALESKIPNKKIFNVITKSKFTSSSPNFETAMAITLCDMTTPYYNYIGTMCGIPKVMIKGDKNEWLYLVNQIKILQNEFNDFSTSVLTLYFARVIDTLNNLITSVFEGSFFRILWNSKGTYLKTMFTYERNKECMSGHSDVVIDGWITNFYVKPGDYVNTFSSHLSCLPYYHKDLQKYYYYVSGLTSSTIDSNGFLHPNYDVVHCEIIGNNKENIFNIIANK